LPECSVTVVVPTLAADAKLLDCLASLEAQSLKAFETVVVDNSACAAIHRLGAARYRFRLIENARNVGFGEAVNQGYQLRPAAFLAVLNDDAVAQPRWLEALVGALEARPEAGMAASRVTLKGTGLLDSAGLGIARDGSSKQVGRMRPAGTESRAREALIPSGCAALYRGTMLEQVGLFDPDFFLYCEDTDLALRAHWAGWRCLYVPDAVVEHHYSASAGRASAAKAYFVERNRLRLLIRNFPLSWLAAAPFHSAWRYWLHLAAAFRGRGKAGEFRASGEPFWMLPWIVLKAHAALLSSLPALLGQRARIKATRRIGAGEFKRRLASHRISLREVAEQ
jgi:GT2 family glycosyltransferase